MTNSVKDYRSSIQDYAQKLIKELQAGGTDGFKDFLKFSAKFHKYSANNKMLIKLQMPNATKVASFRKWNELGRSVKKGEKAIRILAPIFKKSQRPNSQGQMEEKIDGVWFKTVPVFDISQTEGEAVPTWNIRSELGDDDQGLYTLLKEKIMARGIQVKEEALNGPLGVSYGGLIKIDTTVQDKSSQFLTLVHEQAHEILHRGSESKDLSRNDKECQAEATAYIVASHFGLESSVSAEYLICWGNSEKEFLKNLSAVIKASEEILEMLTNQETVSSKTNNEVCVIQAA